MALNEATVKLILEVKSSIFHIADHHFCFKFIFEPAHEKLVLIIGEQRRLASAHSSKLSLFDNTI